MPDTPRPRQRPHGQTPAVARDPLFLLPQAVSSDPGVDAWFGQQQTDLGRLAQTWFDRLRACGDDVRVCLHDDQPTACVGEAAFAYVDVFTSHVNVGFFFGASLPDPAGLLHGTGKRGRHVKLKPETSVKATALEALIRAAYRDMQDRVAARRR